MMSKEILTAKSKKGGQSRAAAHALRAALVAIHDATSVCCKAPLPVLNALLLSKAGHESALAAPEAVNQDSYGRHNISRYGGFMKFFMKVGFVCGALAVFSSLVLSCMEDTSINNLFGISAEAPVFTACKVLSGKQVEFNFSTDVRVRYARFIPEIPVEQTLDGNPVSVIFAEERAGGEKITADILVEDNNGNTLNILVPFRTRNDRVPEFVINEIRLDTATSNSVSAGTTHKSEFIEIKTITAGNLGAVRLFIISANDKSCVYELPTAEVSANEYIILHLRSLPTDKAIDETGSELDLAAADTVADSPKDARDIWLPSNKKLIHKTDVIYFVDQDDSVIDGLVLCEDEKSWTKNSAFAKSAEFLAKQGAWLNADGIQIKSPSFSDAAASTGTTATRTLCRDETKADGNTSADWYICATSKASPGKKNNSDVYEPK
jgi:hypothetical protein